MVAAARLIDQEYLRAFHQRHPGITEDVLTRATSEGITPYQWLAEAVGRPGRVLDLACGSAPMSRTLPEGGTYLGVDRSPAELAAARAGGVRAVVRTNADALPLSDGSMDAVACSMALMILQPVDAVLAEIRRVLRPGGTLAVTIPVEAGISSRAALVLGRIVFGGALPRSPNTAVLADAEALFARHSLQIVGDERRRFGYTVRSRADARLLLDSLYLPALTPARRRVLAGVALAAVPLRPRVPIPIRRLIAVAG
jgi:SAM-dependent methyltransferase